MELPWFCTHWTKVGGWGEASCRVGFHTIGSVQWSCQGLETYSCSNRDAGLSPFSNSLSISIFWPCFFLFNLRSTWKRKGNMWQSSEFFCLLILVEFLWTGFSALPLFRVASVFPLQKIGECWTLTQQSNGPFRKQIPFSPTAATHRLTRLLAVWVLSRFESYRFGRVDGKKQVYIYTYIYIYICTYIYIYQKETIFLGQHVSLSACTSQVYQCLSRGFVWWTNQ